MFQANLLVCVSAICMPAVAPSLRPALLPWNATGHRIVALIAWSQMTDHARRGVVDLLRQHPRFEDDFEDLMPQGVRDDESLQGKWIFMHAATWPDIARGFKGAELSKYHHPTWHYINWPIYLDEQAEQAILKPPVNYSTTWKPGQNDADLNVVQALAMVRHKLDNTDGSVAPEDRAVMRC